MLLQYAGREFLDDPSLNQFHRAYIRLFGVPISGLRIRLRRVLKEIDKPFTSAIDLGCGKGIFSFELARKYPKAEILGVDIDDQQVRANNHVAEKHGRTNVKFEVRDLLTMDFREKFDLALSVDNLEHIADDVDVLKKIHSALKPGGRLVCHVPAYERIWLFKGKSVNFDVEGHVRPGYRLEELREKLTEAGFSITSLRETYGYWETVTNNVSYLITGARQKNQLLYALAFPLLNSIAWLGRNQDPKGKGAGLIATAIKR